MSVRLQVLFDDAEFARIRKTAAVQHQTVSEWVRQALRQVQREYPTTDADRKIQAVREAVKHGYPTGNIDQMLGEVAKGAAQDAE